jgi:hypothetical protein
MVEAPVEYFVVFGIGFGEYDDFIEVLTQEEADKKYTCWGDIIYGLDGTEYEMGVDYRTFTDILMDCGVITHLDTQSRKIYIAHVESLNLVYEDLDHLFKIRDLS